MQKLTKGQSLAAAKIISVSDSQSGSVIFSDDFEGNQSRWSVSGGLWEIGVPTSGPNAAYRGSKCAATNLSGDYPNNANANLISVPINLPALAYSKDGIKLQFWHWYRTESGYDYCNVWITTDDGQNWTEFKSYAGASSEWYNSVFNLSDYAGEVIKIAFQLTSDGSSTYSGWYIDDVMIQYIENLHSNSIEIAVAANGQFSMGVPDGPVLLYDHPEPGTSATTIRIDGEDYWNYEYLQMGTMVTPPTVQDLTNTCVWQFANKARVTQKLSIVKGSTSSNYDTGEIRYTVANIDYISHSIGIRLMLDTMLGTNDGAPFRVPGTGPVTTETEWDLVHMPPYYQAFDDLNNPTIQSQGTLIGGNAIRPNRFVTTGWQHINDTPWNYTGIVGNNFYWGDYGYDSAAGIYWLPVSLAPGESKEFVTYYGLGGIDIDIQPPLVVGLSAVNGLVFFNDVANGNPFSLSVYLSNSSPGVTKTAQGISTTLNLPSGLQLPTGENSIHAIANMSIGTEQFTTYSIAALASGSGKQTYSLTVAATNITTKTVQKDIYLFSINTMPLNDALVNTDLHTVTAKFNIDMKTSTINATTFRVLDDLGNTLDASVSYYSGERKATLTLKTSLQVNKQYKAVLTSGVQSLDNVNLPFDVEWDFTTASPPKSLILVDANEATIQEKIFDIYKVDNNLTETFKGTRITDTNGKFVLDPTWFSEGDQIKVDQVVYTKRATKPNHDAVDSIMYQIKIDNATFDSLGNISYHILTMDEQQTIKVEHTSVMYNLVVSVEWDADQDYLESLRDGFRYMSNYLYDVTDGQLFINKIAIYDTAGYWNDADVRILCSNVCGAYNNRGVYGITTDDIHIHMPRIYYSNVPDRNRELSYQSTYYPYDWSINSCTYQGNTQYGVPYKGISHEFGHYGFGFYDEYAGENYNPKSIYPGFNFGLMDGWEKYDLPTGIDEMTTEMSSSLTYDPQHQQTWQYIARNGSCWDWFEQEFQNTYNNIYCPIIKPDERPESDFYEGPNNDLDNLQYDVGTILKQNSQIFSYDNGAFMVIILNSDGFGIPIENSKTTLYKNNRTKVIDQGKTAENGMIRVLGANVGDIIRCNARIGLDWFYSESTVGSTGTSLYKTLYETFSRQDSMVVILKRISGNIQMVNNITFQSRNTIQYSILFAQPLVENPGLELIIPSKAPEVLNFDKTSTASLYSLNLNDINESGLLTILAKDDSLNNFFINQNFIISDSLDPHFSSIFYNFDGYCEVLLDPLNHSMQKMLILSSEFLPILDGLESGVERGGSVQTISAYPNQSSLKGNNALTIRYSDSDLRTKSEASLRIFKWDPDNRKWQRVGGDVDTVRNEVTAYISGLGTFAAFTTKTGATGERLDNRNSFFYPNPFNPDMESGHFVFGISKEGDMTIKIYDAANSLVSEMDIGYYRTGSGNEAPWDGKNNQGKTVSNGVYFYIIECSSGERAAGKIAILR